MSKFNVRAGNPGDQGRLKQIDPLLADSDWRLQLVQGALTSGGCVVAEVSGAVFAYAVWDHGFFGRGWVHLIYVSEGARRKGLGNNLLAACEERCCCSVLFLSTNSSNRPMRALADKRGYVESGLIHGLDRGDPEVFYRKEFLHSMSQEGPHGVRG